MTWPKIVQGALVNDAIRCSRNFPSQPQSRVVKKSARSASSTQFTFFVLIPTVLPDGSPVHSFRSLLHELATLTKNTVQVPNTTATFEKLAVPTPLQQRALQLLDLPVSLQPAAARPYRVQPNSSWLRNVGLADRIPHYSCGCVSPLRP